MSPENNEPDTYWVTEWVNSDTYDECFPGDVLAVYYNRKDPQEARVAREFGPPTAAVIIVAPLMAAAGFAAFRFGLRQLQSSGP